jgi:hypothetical protein
MFVTNEENRLPMPVIAGGHEGTAVWGVVSQMMASDVLILRMSRRGSRGAPAIVMLDLNRSAPALDQFDSGDAVLRGAAVLSTQHGQEVGKWTLEPLSEIRIRATENGYDDGPMFTATQFTTAAGRKFSVPYAVATRASRGKRLWRAKAPHTEADS